MADYTLKYTVMKNDDVEKYLSTEQKKQLDRIFYDIEIGRIHDGKDACNDYYVCNQDEPYAFKVWKEISDGEDEKHLNT